MFKAFFGKLRGDKTDIATIDDGVEAMRVLEAMLAGIAQPGVRIAVTR